MFSFEKIKNKDNRYKVFFDGNLINHSFAEKRNTVRDERNFNVYAENRTVGEQLIPLLEKDSSQIDSFIVNSWNKWGDFDVVLMIYEYPMERSGLFKLNISQSWNKVFSFEEYFIEFSRIQGEMFFAINTNSLSENTEIELDFSIEPPLLDEIHQAERLILKYHNHAVKILTDKNLESVESIFQFPDEIKTSCKQYLEYFAQFLKDLGINNVNAGLKEEAGKVLFSVTSTDDIEALDKIREALSVYLNLPSSPVLYNDSFQSMQLKQQVENLQHSQRMKEMEMRSAQYALRLAQQNIENQDKIIVQQNSFIDNQNKIIEKITSKSVMIDSLENKEELEKFCEGFEVGKSEFLIKHFGLHLNPATVLKNVGKKIIGKEESKPILDLNEETNQKDN